MGDADLRLAQALADRYRLERRVGEGGMPAPTIGGFSWFAPRELTTRALRRH